jgi:hypothetical protein
MLFRRGKAISGAPIINGTNQFPKPPIRTGIIKKKIIKNAWAVIRTLYSCQLEFRICAPGAANSIRISTEITVPNSPAKPPNIRYSVPISLWLVEKSHRFNIFIIFN